MAFCFKRKESIAKGVRRLACGRIKRSLECLNDCQRTEAIHCARKEIKKARAVLRLVQTRIAKKRYRSQIRKLRKAANHLAPARDAYVNSTTLKDLMTHFKGQLGPHALRHAQATLQYASVKKSRRFGKKKTAQSVQRILQRAQKKFDGLAVDGKGWKAISPGIKRAYTAGLRAYGAVRKDPSPENFHEWRKRAKDLWYQASMLRSVWCEQMDAMTHELETLGEFLGDDHDLVVLRKALEEKHDTDRQEMKLLDGLINRRQRELRTAALRLGARFYAEKPFAFCNRLQGYWRVWRGKKKSIAAVES
jgi:CHAD domain-containing protein